MHQRFAQPALESFLVNTLRASIWYICT